MIDSVKFNPGQVAGAETNTRTETDARRPVWIHGLGELAERYDTFLIDQWGVLHDGNKPYPAVLDTLRTLRERGKTVVILSNSGKRSADNVQRLEALGIPQPSYSLLVTSGEVARELLRTHAAALDGFAGKTCFQICGEETDRFLDGLDIRPMPDLASADFILLRGLPLAPDERFLQQMIDTGVATGKPMICANPDHVRITPDGIKPSAGDLANRYEAAGGRVLRIGKPYPEIYLHALEHAGASGLGSTLAIGDSMHHDVAGAHAAGMDALLVLCGVLKDKLDPCGTPAQRLEAVSRLAADASECPDWVAEQLSW